MNTYQLLDSGNYQKLEKMAGFTIIRPSLNSPYKKQNPELWQPVDAEYKKNTTGSGQWYFKTKIPERMIIELQGLRFISKLTPFGHIGLFPEQQQNWHLLEKIGQKQPGLETLNLFAYSGASTLAGLKGGLSMCHLDSSKGMVEWARENARVNQLDQKPIRWIVDDVLKFTRRELKRQRKYSGFILDPPTFGRGSKGEVWKIEKHLLELMAILMQLSDHKPDFMILSCHSSGFSPQTLQRILSSHIQKKGRYFSRELFITEKSQQKLSGGYCAYFLADSLTTEPILSTIQ